MAASRSNMVAVTTKMPRPTAERLRRRARKEGKTPSQLLREAVEEYLAPPSTEWAKALQRLPRLTPKRRLSDEELQYEIDTTL